MTRAMHSLMLVTATAICWADCGCAVNVQRTRDVSSAGIAYTQATAALIDVAIDAEIDADSEVHVRTNEQPLGLSKTEFADRLGKSDQGLIDNVKEWQKLKGHVATLEAYFTALQTLADGSQAQGTRAAVEDLADRLGALNKALGSNKPLLSEKQKEALGGLTELVAKEIHGALLGNALQRDAAIIGEALALQEKLVEQAEISVLGRLREANGRFYVEKVLTPFQNPPLSSGWVADRRVYIKAAGLGQAAGEVTSTQAAAKQMQDVWKKILAGEYAAAEIASLLQETQDFLAAMTALKNAEQPKASITQ